MIDSIGYLGTPSDEPGLRNFGTVTCLRGKLVIVTKEIRKCCLPFRDSIYTIMLLINPRFELRLFKRFCH